MRRQIEKVAAAQLLEAVKEVLDHLSQWQIALNQQGEESPAGLTACYGRVRRLRDYLYRSVAAYPSPVMLDLDEEDENLLAACAVHSLGVIDLQLTGNRGLARERAWAEEKRRALAHWAVALASRPLERIPAADPLRLTTPTVRAVIGSIQAKSARRTPDPHDAGLFGDTVELGPSKAERRIPDAVAVGVPPPVDGQEPPPPPELAPLLDPSRVRDPRLRGMVVLDQRAYRRARAADDYRLAMLHLSSIVEAAVLDHVIPRTHELGLRGTPETWKIEELLVKVLADRLTSMDRAYLLHLLAARNLVRPAIQLGAPMAITASSVAQGEDLVRRILVELGFNGGPSASGVRSAVSPAASQTARHFEQLVRQLERAPDQQPPPPPPRLEPRLRPGS